MLKTIATACAVMLLAGHASAADTFPARPVRIVVPYAAGGATDYIARTVGDRLSKSLGPGLQIGMLALPSSLCDAAQDFLRELPTAPSALSCAVVDDWLATGVIASIQQDLRHEAQRRSKLAASLLGARGLVWHSDAYNTWLPMKRDAADGVVSAAMDMGVKLTSPQSTMVRPSDSASGLRICLGGASWEDLNESLEILAMLLK